MVGRKTICTEWGIHIANKEHIKAPVGRAFTLLTGAIRNHSPEMPTQDEVTTACTTHTALLTSSTPAEEQETITGTAISGGEGLVSGGAIPLSPHMQSEALDDDTQVCRPHNSRLCCLALSAFLFVRY